MSDPTWLPADWQHPTRVELSTGHHLRPIHADDTDAGPARGDRLARPPLGDLRRGLGLATAGDDGRAGPRGPAAPLGRDPGAQSSNYALFDADETELVGCCYIDPTDKAGADADISWWVRDEYVGSPVEAALDAFVPGWIPRDSPFVQPRYVGLDLSWAEWMAIPRQR